MPAILRPLANPAVALLWAGLATSAVGDQLFAVVLNWAAVGVFGAAAGYLAALQAGTVLVLALSLGRWADRHDHYRAMIAADAGRAAVLLTVVLAWTVEGAPPGWALIACVLALAAGQTLFRPAMQASLPGLVDDASGLPAANALLDTTERIARLLGPGLVAMASGWLALVHFVTFDAATFLASGAAVLAIARLRPATPLAPLARPSMLENMRRGFGAVRRHRLLSWQLATTGPINGTWYAAYFLCAPLILERAGHGLAAYGLLISAYGSTNVLTTLAVGGAGLARRPDRMIFGGNLFVGAGIVLMAWAALLAPPAWLAPLMCASAAVSAIGGPMQDITTATLRQTLLARADIAPAIRAFMVMSSLGLLTTLLAAPWIIGRIGVEAAVLGCGAAIMGIGLLGLASFARR